MVSPSATTRSAERSVQPESAEKSATRKTRAIKITPQREGDVGMLRPSPSRPSARHERGATRIGERPEDRRRREAYRRHPAWALRAIRSASVCERT